MESQEKATESSEPYTIDLEQIKGNGEFPCPRCGVMISPNDESEEVYQLIDAKVEKEELTEIILKCLKCQSTIRVIGFVSKQ